jgi:serine protease Do
MNTRNCVLAAGLGVLSLGLLATPEISQAQDTAPVPPPQEAAPPQAVPAPPKVTTRMKIRTMPDRRVMITGPDEEMNQEFALAFDDEGGSWLGVETQEVTAEKAKDLKLSAERGVVIGKVLEESPAAKAGLKDGDVVTALNGQQIESALQFRRMIKEIPSGRTVQLSVWRDGRAQTVSATLGKMQEHSKRMMGAMPQVFNFRMPEMPEVAPIPDMPSLEWDGDGALLMNRPRLGIDAEDIGGQLGSFFGAPDGEAILVRDVNAGSAAEKAGLKAGDVITSFNGEKLHSLSDLRSKLFAAGDGKTVKLGVLRNKSAITLNVELPEAKKKTAVRKMELRTKI